MEVKTDENLEKDEVNKGDEVLENAETKTRLENAESEAEKDAKPQKFKASEVYAEESYELQAQKSEEVFEETAKEVEPPYEEPAREVIAKEANQNQRLLLLKHFGKSLGNMSIVFVSFMLLLVFSQLVLGVGTVLLGFILGTILFVLSIATLGLIYLTGVMGSWWGFVGKLFEGGTDIINFLGKLYVTFPYMIVGSLVFSIISIITTAKSGAYKSVGRIVASSIVCGISAILSIFLIAGGLSAK
ncbi:MAG: hypothetical protein J6T39_01025 [Clostridia bacterium]|nr:hypothetical protein [Clostridia bacterium]